MSETRYMQTAAMALMLYDHLLTFPVEVELIWNGTPRRSWPRVLFVIARYAPLIGVYASASGLYGSPQTVEFCHNWLLFHGWSGVAFYTAAQVLSQIRLWMIYRTKYVLIFNGIIVALGVSVMATIAGLAFRGMTVIPPLLNIQQICGPVALPPAVHAFWIPPIIIETTSCLLVVYKAIENYRDNTPKQWMTSRLIRAICIYSVAYWFLVMTTYTINITIWRHLPIAAFDIFIPMTFALPSVAGNRMLLTVRAIFFADTHAWALSPLRESVPLQSVSPISEGKFTLSVRDGND